MLYNTTDLRKMHTIYFFFHKADEMLPNIKKKRQGGYSSKKQSVALNTPVDRSCFLNAFFLSWTGESEIGVLCSFSPLGLKESW